MAEMYGGITPEMLNTVSRGTAAQSSLNGLANNPETIKALRDANTPYGQVQGQGFSSSAPGGLQVLGEIVNRNAGNQGIKKMQTQADALRGQIAKGSEQELMMQLQMARAKEDAARAAAAEKLAWEREKLAAQQARADEDRLSKEEIARLKAANKPSGLTPTGSERKSYNESMRLGKVVEGLINDFEGMTEEERGDLDNRIKEGILYSPLTPNVVQRWGEEALLDTEKGKVYKTKLARLESKLSQLASGMAVTGYEMSDRQEWSPNAPGISGAAPQRRIRNIRDDLMSEKEAFEQYYPEYSVGSITEEIEPTDQGVDGTNTGIIDRSAITETGAPTATDAEGNIWIVRNGQWVKQ